MRDESPATVYEPETLFTMKTRLQKSWKRLRTFFSNSRHKRLNICPTYAELCPILVPVRVLLVYAKHLLISLALLFVTSDADYHL